MMFKGCTMLSTESMGRGEWLEERRKGIGGSDAAAIIGLNPWATPYTVYLDKLGLLSEKEETEAMRQGRDLEDYVAKRFTEETGKKVQRCKYMIQNPAYPFALADIDRRVVGEDAGLECKTTSALDIRQFHGVDFPEKYYAQCVHYLAVTGAKRWHLAVLVFGKGFFVYTLDRDEAEIAALMATESAFWEKVQNQTPPDITGGEADSAAVDGIYKQSEPGEIADLFGMDSLFFQMQAADMSLKISKAAKDTAANQIKERMKTAEEGTCGPFRCTWKTQTRRTLNLDLLLKDYPDIKIDDYMTTTTSRPFRYNVVEDNKEE